ncbi:hypothetical protein, partial [Xanthomonas citri]
MSNCLAQVCTAAALGVAAMTRSVIGICVLPETAWSASQPLGDVENFSNVASSRGKRAVIRACRERATGLHIVVVHGDGCRQWGR